MSSRIRKVVVIPGEDAAPEAMHPSIEVLDALGLPIEWQYPLVGIEAKEQVGNLFPDQARAAIDASDATFFGSTSGPSAPALFHLRWGRETYANVRPSRWFPGVRSVLAEPEEVDFIIVRENLEDLYMGIEGDISELDALDLSSRFSRRAISDYAPARYAIKVISEAGSRQVIRHAFELAGRRKSQGHPGRLTCATKYNMLPKSDGYFKEIAVELSRDYPEIEFESFIIDDFGHRMVSQADALDVVVMPNLYGDIMSDTAAGLVGGLGLAASGCYGDDYAYFESAHGTAPDIAGRNIINPTATLFSGSMLLEYLGFEEASKRLRLAIEAVYAVGKILTPDQGGAATTQEFAAAVRDGLAAV